MENMILTDKFIFAAFDVVSVSLASPHWNVPGSGLLQLTAQRNAPQVGKTRQS
jgi:hypothetical protein